MTDPSARLAAAHARLVVARDMTEVLAAIVDAVRPYDPAHVDIRYLHLDERGEPERMQPLAVWADGAMVPDHPYLARRQRIADSTLARHWLARPYDILHVADVLTDPRCDQLVRDAIAPRRALVAVPLHSRHPAGWQGVVLLHWHQPHEPDAEELLILRTLQHVVAAVVAGHRASLAFESALAEARALYRVSARLNEAATPADLLAVITDLALSAGAAHGALLLVDPGADGEPAAIHVAAAHGPPELALPVGARHPPDALDHPDVGQTDPDAPRTIDDITAAEHVDPITRSFHAATGIHAALLLPLRRQGRSIGYFHLGWQAPHRFSDGERRLFRGLARQAAAVLDNRLLYERTQRAAHANRAQEQTLEALLDHLPLGVTVLDRTGRRTRINRAGLALIDIHEDDLRRDHEPDIRTFHLGTDRRIQRDERLTIQALAAGEIRTGELEVQQRDGTRRIVSGTAAPTRDERGEIDGCVLLYQDITDRVASAREQARIHAAILAAQAAALAERQAPILPLTDEILVVPIVGTIDAARGDELLTTLLSQGARARARVVILDLTGVPSLDPAGAAVLVSAARGLRLRGALAILSGLRPDVAWTLVAENIDLAALHAVGTLQSALALARRLAAR